MSNYTYGAVTICPFYLKEAKKSITCEGLADGTDMMIRFRSEEDKRSFQAGNCAMYNYDRCCPMAAALLSKYED